MRNRCEVFYYLKSPQLNDNYISEAIKQVYESKIPIELKKSIINHAVGKLGKKKNIKSKSYVAKNREFVPLAFSISTITTLPLSLRLVMRDTYHNTVI